MTLVCPQCFGEPGLKKRIVEIRPQFPNKKCDFHPEYKGVPIKAVAEIVDSVFRAHYGFGDYGYDEQFGDSLETQIADLVEAEFEVVEALVDQLIEDDDYWPPDGGEPFYDQTQNYDKYEHHDFRHSELWERFCDDVVHRQRFFNTDARDLIAEIFDGVQFQRDHQQRSPVYQIQPHTPEGRFFRARVADLQSKQKQIADNPAKELGPPPKRMRRAGRMNPAGVGCFYGAYDIQTCIAELRPRVGSTVIGAQFGLIRPIYVLDTTRFEEPIKSASLFTKNYLDRQAQWTFMQSFRLEIAKPISPDDEHLDYIPTQAVAEYLLHHHEFKRNGKSVKIEAIIFRSAQRPNGKNIALLGEAASVVSPVIPDMKAKKGSSLSDDAFGTFGPYLARFGEERNPALQLDADSVEIRQVTGAQFDSKPIERHLAFDDEADF